VAIIQIVATARSKASAALVFALLKDGETWPRWSMFDSFELERSGAAEPMGLGAIRVFRTSASCAREEIVELIPDRQLSYVLLSGFPFRDYRADVTLEPRDGGTEITWRASFAPKYAGTGWFWRAFMTSVLQKVATQLARGPES
jgi:hypothetical protein